jgi:hypothetical protein
MGNITLEQINTKAQESLRSIKSKSITKPTSGNSVKNWNPNTGTFSKKFTSAAKSKYVNMTESPWVAGISAYEDYLIEFTSASLFEITELSKDLLKMTSPSTGSPDGIQILLELLRTAALSLTRQIQNSSTFGFGGLEVKKPTSGVSARKETIKIVKSFDDFVDTNRILDTGIDYLDINPLEENIGVKKVNLQQYFQRVKREYNTIFSLENDVPIDISIKYGTEVYTEGDNLDRTGYSYLGPSYIVRNGNKIISRVGNSPSPLSSPSVFASYGATTSISALNTTTTQQINDTITHEVGIPSGDKVSTSFLGPPIIRSTETTEEKTSNSLSDGLLSHFSFGGVSVGSVPNITVDKFDVSVKRGETLKTDRVSTKIDLPVYAFTPTLNYPPREDFTNLLMYLLGDKREKRTQINKYNLYSAGNYLTEILSNPDKIDKEMWGIPSNQSVSVGDVLKFLPNQTKALFLETSSPEKVKKKWVSRQTTSITQQLETATEFDIFQNNIQSIEVLADFIQTDLGFHEVSSPVWKSLTPDLLDNNRNKHFICRMRQYTNTLIGVIPKETRENIFDECFVILPPEGFSRNGFGSPFVPLGRPSGGTVSPSSFLPGQNLVDRGLVEVLGTGQSNVQKDVISTKGDLVEISTQSSDLQQIKSTLSAMKVQQEQEQNNIPSVFTTTNITGIFLNKKI